MTYYYQNNLCIALIYRTIENRESIWEDPCGAINRRNGKQSYTNDGRTKGLSLKSGALSRHNCGIQERVPSNTARDVIATGSQSFRHSDLSQSRINRDEKGVRALDGMLNSNWTQSMFPPISLE